MLQTKEHKLEKGESEISDIYIDADSRCFVGSHSLVQLSR